MSNFFDILTFSPYDPLRFNSVFFFILFTAFFAVYTVAANRIRLRNILLLIFSYYFYYRVSGTAAIILLGISVSDFFIGKSIAGAESEKRKNMLLLLSVCIDIGLLAYFKYTNFFLEQWHYLAGTEYQFSPLSILLPAGISFFIFKSLSYIIDVKREVIEPESDPINYFLYVAFFPNILAGPISKARDLLPQFRLPTTISSETIGKGFFLIMGGAFKKVVIADYLSNNLVQRVLEGPSYFNPMETLFAFYASALRFYCDFSGYTDMVIGIALLMGFTIHPNFNQPFLAAGVADFWRRWHITLNEWFSDYLYYPLAFGLRSMKLVGAILAVMLVFFISGLWHGAAWTFIIWGLSHGIFISLELLFAPLIRRAEESPFRKPLKVVSVFITFHFIALSFVLLQSDTIGTAMVFFGNLFSAPDFSLFGEWYQVYQGPFWIMIAGYLLHFLPERMTSGAIDLFTRLHWIGKAVIFFIFIVLVYQVFSTESLPFIYLQF